MIEFLELIELFLESPLLFIAFFVVIGIAALIRIIYVRVKRSRGDADYGIESGLGGKVVHEEASESPIPQPAPKPSQAYTQAPPSNSVVGNCTYCGKPISSGDKKCNSCGAPLNKFGAK